AIVTTNAQEPKAYWENEFINEVNREPMHTNFFAYENLTLAKKGNPASSQDYMSLNGSWKFKWVPKPADKPLGFWKTDYDDAQCDNFEFPATGEVSGCGGHSYPNLRYACDYLRKPDPPHVPHGCNPVGSYRREVVIDKGWEGKDIYHHLDG